MQKKCIELGESKALSNKLEVDEKHEQEYTAIITLRLSVGACDYLLWKESGINTH